MSPSIPPANRKPPLAERQGGPEKRSGLRPSFEALLDREGHGAEGCLVALHEVGRREAVLLLNVKQFSKKYEAYQPFAIIAVLALLLEILLRITIFRRIP